MYRRCFRTLAVALAALSAAACTRRLYEGPARPADDIAVIDAHQITILDISDKMAFAAAFGAQRFEVTPGNQQVVLAYERPARSIGIRDIPAQRGEGTCIIDFVAEAGKQYEVTGRPLGTDWTMRNWDGKWEGWIRDLSRSGDAAIVARCESSTVKRTRILPDPVIAAAPPAGAVPPAPIPAAPVPPAPPILAPVPAPAVPGSGARQEREQWIRVGTWNVRARGAGGEGDYGAIAAAIDGNFDILTLTEIAAVGGIHPGYDRLMATLGDKWAGQITNSPRPNVAAGAAEYYAIVYRRAVIRPCSGWTGLRYVTDNDGGPSGIGSDRFVREPAFGCFEAGIGGDAAGVDFMLAAYRATWAGGDTDVIAAEVSHIDAAFAEMSRARPGERDLILAGQLNLESVELRTLTAAAVRSEGSGSTLNLLGEPTYGLRDHILVYDAVATAEMDGNGTVLDVRGVADSPREFRRSVSDHLPVMVRLRATGPDDD